MPESNPTPTRVQRMILLAIAGLAVGTFVFGVLALRYGGRGEGSAGSATTNSAAGRGDISH